MTFFIERRCLATLMDSTLCVGAERLLFANYIIDVIKYSTPEQESVKVATRWA